MSEETGRQLAIIFDMALCINGFINSLNGLTEVQKLDLSIDLDKFMQRVYNLIPEED